MPLKAICEITALFLGPKDRHYADSQPLYGPALRVKDRLYFDLLPSFIHPVRNVLIPPLHNLLMAFFGPRWQHRQ